MKKFIVVLFSVFLLISCNLLSSENNTQNGGAINGKQGGTPGVNTGNQTITYIANTPSRDIIANTENITSFDETISVTLNGNTANCSSEDCIVTSDSNLVTIKYTGNNNVQFNITGSLNEHGLLISYGDEGVKKKAICINLTDVAITSNNTPCIYTIVKGSQPLLINLNGTNKLTDGRTFGTNYDLNGDSSKGTLYSKGPVLFSGSGTLTISEGYKHAVASKDYIKVNSGTIIINSTGRNGFQAVNGFVMNNGNITINGSGTHTNNQSRGIVVEGSEDNPGEGFIVIKDGTLNITTVSKAITAKWDIDEDSTTAEITDDPYPYLKITGGNITIKTTGTPTEGRNGTFINADGESVTEEIKLVPEGIEGKQAVFITGGTISLNCTDDCINAGRDGSAIIEISGGNIFARSSKNDAIDSNGSLTISGGNVVAIATNAPECAFDCDNYTFAITGGYVAGFGTSKYSEPTPSSCTQGVLVLASEYLGSAGKTIAVKNSSGDVVYAFTIPTTCSVNGNVGIFSNPNLNKTDSYSLVKGANVSTNSSFNGLYTLMPAIFGGTSYNGISFSNSYVYTAGSTGNIGPQEGPRFKN